MQWCSQQHCQQYIKHAAAAAKSLQSCPTLWDPMTAAHQAPPSLGFSRQEHWSGLPFPSPMHESEKWKWSHLVVPDSQQSHVLQPTRLLRPWDFPGKSTGVGCHCLLQLCSSHFYIIYFFSKYYDFHFVDEVHWRNYIICPKPKSNSWDSEDP